MERAKQETTATQVSQWLEYLKRKQLQEPDLGEYFARLTFFVYQILCRIEMRKCDAKDHKAFLLKKVLDSDIAKKIRQPNGLTKKQFARQSKTKWFVAVGHGNAAKSERKGLPPKMPSPKPKPGKPQ